MRCIFAKNKLYQAKRIFHYTSLFYPSVIDDEKDKVFLTPAPAGRQKLFERNFRRIQRRNFSPRPAPPARSRGQL
jgi:hypothetical protein